MCSSAKPRKATLNDKIYTEINGQIRKEGEWLEPTGGTGKHIHIAWAEEIFFGKLPKVDMVMLVTDIFPI